MHGMMIGSHTVSGRLEDEGEAAQEEVQQVLMLLHYSGFLVRKAQCQTPSGLRQDTAVTGGQET